MATENIPHIEKLMKSYGEQFRKYVKGANRAIEQAIKGINQSRESEGKTMTHNVEITTTENKVIEEYWVMIAKKDVIIAEHNLGMGTDKVVGSERLIHDRKELNHNPTLQEIAQFLSESKADFVSVEHNYRFADLPFC